MFMFDVLLTKVEQIEYIQNGNIRIFEMMLQTFFI